MTYEIESGVPIPDGLTRVSSRRQSVKNLASAAKGSSIFFPLEEGKRKENLSTNIRASAIQFIGSGRYALRAVEGGFRLWKTTD